MNRIEQIHQFLEKSPNDCFLKHALALEYIKAQQDEKARIIFMDNLNFDEKYIATYYHLGKLLERQNELKEALQIYEKGMKVAKELSDNHAYGELALAHEFLEDEL